MAELNSSNTGWPRARRTTVTGESFAKVQAVSWSRAHICWSRSVTMRCHSDDVRADSTHLIFITIAKTPIFDSQQRFSGVGKEDFTTA